MIIEIKEKPLSVNQAWQGKRYKTYLYKQYEKKMLLILPKAKKPFSDMLRVEIHFGFSNVGSDIDNPVKPLLDILQKKYGFNDKNIFELNLRKNIVDKGEEFMNIVIYQLLPFEDE